MSDPIVNRSLPVIHCLSSADGRTQVEYELRGDRFVHRVFIDGAEVATSVDGDARPAWPASPPIQEVSLEPIDGQPTILGVGAAGRGHWSISISAHPGSAGGTASSAIRFDMACRVKVREGFLGSSYRLADDSPAELAILAECGLSTRDGNLVTIEPTFDEAATTHRWVYDLGPVAAEAQDGKSG